MSSWNHFSLPKMFFIRDPFAPLVDPCKPSQARATKVHLRCKWLTQKKHFHGSEKWFHSGNAFTVEKRDICSFAILRDFFSDFQTPWYDISNRKKIVILWREFWRLKITNSYFCPLFSFKIVSFVNPNVSGSLYQLS